MLAITLSCLSTLLGAFSVVGHWFDRLPPGRRLTCHYAEGKNAPSLIPSPFRKPASWTTPSHLLRLIFPRLTILIPLDSHMYNAFNTQRTHSLFFHAFLDVNIITAVHAHEYLDTITDHQTLLWLFVLYTLTLRYRKYVTDNDFIVKPHNLEQRLKNFEKWFCPEAQKWWGSLRRVHMRW